MSDKINTQVGIKLKARRIMLGLSQNALGKEIGVASQQVQKYEKGTNAMNAERLYEFAKILKVPVAYFFEDIEKKSKQDSKVLSFAEEGSEYQNENGNASDRETIEVLKSFKRIKDHAIRKRISDLLRSVSLKDI